MESTEDVGPCLAAVEEEGEGIVKNEQVLFEQDSVSLSVQQDTQEFVSSVEEGQILETSSDGSESVRAGKRPCSVLSEGSTDNGIGAPKKAKKRISFSEVTAYYFPRAQGFTCVPSQVRRTSF